MEATAAVAVAVGQKEGGAAGDDAAPADTIRVAAAAAAPASVDSSPSGSDDARSKLCSESSASKVIVGIDAPRDISESAINQPHGGRDEDVRRYEQGFRGLSSSYGAYSSVFNSQVRSPGAVDGSDKAYSRYSRSFRVTVACASSAFFAANVFFFCRHEFQTDACLISIQERPRKD